MCHFSVKFVAIKLCCSLKSSGEQWRWVIRGLLLKDISREYKVGGVALSAAIVARGDNGQSQVVER